MNINIVIEILMDLELNDMVCIIVFNYLYCRKWKNWFYSFVYGIKLRNNKGFIYYNKERCNYWYSNIFMFKLYYKIIDR